MINIAQIRHYLDSESGRWHIRLLVAAILLIFLAFFWRMVIHQDFFPDDVWRIMAGFASAEDVGEIAREVFKFENTHFFPLQKLYMLGMYSLFSFNQVPYNIMSIVLFAISLIFYYSFISDAMNDRSAATLSTIAMGTTSAYHQVMFWPLEQSQVFSMIFLLLALIYINKGMEHGGEKYFVAASSASVISALFFTTGLLAAPVATLYLIIRSLSDKPGSLRTMAIRAAILLVPMLVYFPIYLSFNMENYTTSNMVLSPFILMKTALIIIGNLVTSELFPVSGLFRPIIAFLGKMDSIGIKSADTAISIIFLAVFVILCFAIILLYIKASKKLRPMILFGFFTLVLYASLYAAGRGEYYDGGLDQLLSISRYKHFPSLGLFVIIAACISHFTNNYSKRRLYVATALVLSLALLHQSYLIKVDSYLQSKYIGESEQIEKIELLMKNPKSMAYKFEPGSTHLGKYFSIFKNKDDAIIVTPQMLYVLRSHVDVKPEDIVFAKGSLLNKNDKKVVFEAPAEIIISSSQPNSIQHLVFMLKSYGDSDFRLTCQAGNDVFSTDGLKTDSRWYYKFHAIPCPFGSKLTLKFNKGIHKIKNIRLYN